MLTRRMTLTLAAAVLLTMPASTVLAQRGALLEDLFRTWAETQIERETRQRPVDQRPVDPQRANPRPELTPRIPNTPVPNPRVPSGSANPGPAGSDARVTAAWQTIQQQLTAVADDLRVTSRTQASLRPLVPDAFQLAARAEQLARMSTGRSASQLIEVYPQFDRDYRQFSFGLRSQPGVSTACRTGIATCDSWINRVSKHYSVSPQWDRDRFADVVVMAGAYLQTMMDDLQFASVSREQSRRLTSDLQRLVERLRVLRPNLSSMTYDQVAAEFNQFSADMVILAREIRSQRNPYLDRRLERLRELADESYALLWMPPPIDQGSLLECSTRIELAIDTLRDQLNSRVLRDLPPTSRRAIDDLVRTIDRNAHRLADIMRHHPDDREIPAMLQEIDLASLELQRQIGFLPGLHHASLSAIRDETEHLMLAMQIPRAQTVLDYSTLRSLGSSLEGSAEYLRADLRRYERYMKPNSFRGDVFRAADAFYRASRDFHAAADDQRELNDLFQRQQLVLQTWQTLDASLMRLSRQGVPASGVAAIMRYRDRLLQPIASLAAMLGGDDLVR